MENTILQAIVTKYIGASNFKPSRIKAFCAGGSITLSYDHDLNAEQNHRVAAEALRDRMKWDGELIQGGLPTGYVFTFMPKLVGYSCAVCGKTGPEHGHADVTDDRNHFFKCGALIYQ